MNITLLCAGAASVAELYIVDIKAMLLRCMSIVGKFEEEHPGCVVQNMPLTTAGGFEMSCDVIVVPRESCWTLDEEATHRDGELVVSVAPRYAFEGDWPLVLVDVYVLSPEALYAKLRIGTAEPSSIVGEYTSVGPAGCVHVGEANLSKLLGEEKPSQGVQMLHCQYNVDLGFQDEISSSESVCIKLKFQVRKAPRPKPLTRTLSGPRKLGSVAARASLTDNIEALKAFI
jgi:hypothetical protein